jgi:hypothetical protein
MRSSRERAAIFDLLIRPFHISKKEFFQSIIENLEKWSPMKGSQMIQFDSREFIDDRKEEMIGVVNRIHKQRPAHAHKSIKMNQVMNMEFSKFGSRSIPEYSLSEKNQNSESNCASKSPKIIRQHRPTYA